MNKITNSDSTHTLPLSLSLSATLAGARARSLASISRACCETKLYFVREASETSSAGGSKQHAYVIVCFTVMSRGRWRMCFDAL